MGIVAACVPTYRPLLSCLGGRARSRTENSTYPLSDRAKAEPAGRSKDLFEVSHTFVGNETWIEMGDDDETLVHKI